MDNNAVFLHAVADKLKNAKVKTWCISAVWYKDDVQVFQRNLRACKILKWIPWPRPCPFQGWSAIWRLSFYIACKRTKFDDSSFSCSRHISGVWNSRMRYVALTVPT